MKKPSIGKANSFLLNLPQLRVFKNKLTINFLELQRMNHFFFTRKKMLMVKTNAHERGC